MLEDIKNWNETAKEPRAKTLIEFINILQGKTHNDIPQNAKKIIQ